MSDEREYLTMEDEDGNESRFAIELAFEVDENTYAVLTHVDDDGNNLSEESMLFQVDESEEGLSFEPIEDEDEFDRIHGIIHDMMNQPGL